MKKVFVCSPYSGDIEGNTARAIKYCQAEIAAGNIPFAPHLIFPRMLDENKPEDRELGIRMGLEMMRCCDELHVYGQHISQGMQREIAKWDEMNRFAVEKKPLIDFTGFVVETPLRYALTNN